MKQILILIFFLFSISVYGQINLVNQTHTRFMQNAGGKEEFRRICRQEMKYPAEALQENIKGKVSLKFKVKKDGTLDHMKVKKSVNPAIDAEAIRLVSMLQWLPAIYKGNLSDAFAEYVIHFNPKKYKKIVLDRGYDSIILPPAADTSLVVYDMPETHPSFIENGVQFDEYISKQIIYPRKALKKNTEGEVLISFIVEPSGMITNLQVEKPLTNECNKEALRVVEKTRWHPATYQNMFVRSRMSVPVRFQLSSENNSGNNN